MSEGLNQDIGDIVCAVVTDGATPPVILTSAGVNAQTATPAGVVRNGKGDYTINFPLNQCDPLSRLSSITASGAGQIVNVGASSDSSQNVGVTDAAGAAADGGFSLIIHRTKTP